MSKVLVIRIDIEGDDLTDDDGAPVPARVGALIHGVSTRLTMGQDHGSIRDINGNTVGTFGYKGRR